MKIVTANRLLDGEVVFRGTGGVWVADIDHAETLADGQGADAALASGHDDEAGCIVVGVELIDVTVADGHIVPVKLRERLRALGPSVALELNQSRFPASP